MKTMTTFAVVSALTGLDGTADVASMDRQELQQMMRGLARGRSVLAAMEAEVLARYAEIDCASMAEYTLSNHGRLAPGHARTVMQRAEAIAQMPSFGTALEDNTTTPEHVDALARGLKKLGAKKHLLVECESRLLAEASVLTVPRFARLVENLAASLDQQSENDRFGHQCRSTELKLWEDHRTGMIRLSGQFDPERGSRLWTILDAKVEVMFHGPDKTQPAAVVDENDHLRGLALCELVEAAADVDLPTSTERRINTEVIVTIDLDTLVRGVHAESTRRDVNGTDLPVDVIRRMCCDAGIVPMVLNGEGVVVDVGRSKRLASRRQRRAIFAMHETCAAPGCGVKVKHCVPHHITWWESGGATDLENLVPLCSRHHHAVHEGGWGLSMDGARHVTMTPPLVVTSP